MVPVEYLNHEVTSQWIYIEGYMTQFYKVSHPYMTQDTPGTPNPTHEELLKDQWTLNDHVVDVLSCYQTIIRLTRQGIKSGVFARNGDEAVGLIESIISNARSARAYRKQRRNQGVRIKHTQQSMHLI